MNNNSTISKYEKNVEQFLNNKRVSTGCPFTHVAMAETFVGKFNLDKAQIKEFTKLYAESVTNGAVFSIAEKPKDYGPLLIDIDLEMSLENNDGNRLYNDNMIYEIINAYREVTNEYLNLSDEELTASVFEKPKPTIKSTIIKDGVHIIFHGINAHYKLRYLIRNKVVQKLNDSKTFKKFINPVEKIIDKQVVHTNCWLLHGSRKKDGQLYELKYIYDKYNESIDITKILSDKYKMIRLYSLQDKLRNEKYSTNFNDGFTLEIIENEFLKMNSKDVKVKSKVNDTDINIIIEKCLQCLPINDYNDYEQWSSIALIINNELGYNGLENLLNWSSDGDGFDKSKVEQFYKNIKPKENGLKIGTLKKMAKESNSILYKKLFKNNNDKKEIKGVYTDLEAAQKVYSLYKNWVCCKEKLFVYDDKTGLWTDSEIVMLNIISRFNDELFLLTISNNGDIKQSKKGYGNSTKLQKDMLPQLKPLCIDNSWLSNTNLSSLDKILYKNGYYDMKTGTFNSNFNPDIVFFNRIDRDYEICNDIDYIESIKNRFFYNQLGEEIGNYLMLNLARSLAGNRMKKIFFNLGETNSGKSTLTTACKNVFTEYIGNFNGENLCIKNSSSDEAQLMRWTLLLRYKRIIFSNEMKNENSLDANMIKKLSSGGDEISGRLHRDNEMEFSPHFNLFCNANDLPKVENIKEDSATIERINIISYKKKYVDEPSNEYELKKDTNIDNEMKTIKFMNAFQHILFNSYLIFCQNEMKENIPDLVKNCKIEWLGDDAGNSGIIKFLESYDITNNVDDYIKSNEIDYFIKENKVNISSTKFTMELKKYCKIKKYDNIESKLKKISGKVIRCWIGIKKIQFNDDDDENTSLDI